MSKLFPEMLFEVIIFLGFAVLAGVAIAQGDLVGAERHATVAMLCAILLRGTLTRKSIEEMAGQCVQCATQMRHKGASATK